MANSFDEFARPKSCADASQARRPVSTSIELWFAASMLIASGVIVVAAAAVLF